METNELEKLLDQFLHRWPISKVKKMNLQDYVDVGNKDTFCQWVETKTSRLGSIKGMTSIKFGIYKRKKSKKIPKNYQGDKKYSWLKGYGNNRKVVFNNVKNDIVKVIELSEKGQFNEINEIILPNLFKWKIAFLYSNERLIPIYQREALNSIAVHFGLRINLKTKISEIQNLMISNKPANQSVYYYMRELYGRFSSKKKKTGKTSSNLGKRKKRKGTKTRSTTPQVRSSHRSYIAEQKHNKIQEALKERLIKKYGKENVILEENYVDVKLIRPKYLGFYEVKSSSYASECVREALGQILLYSYHDDDNREKKIYVVGQYPANEEDLGYIDYIKKNLSFDFEYLNVGIE